MWRRLSRAALAAAALASVAAPARATDPYLEWYTIETPRFRVHYHSGLGELAQRVATLVEDVHARLAPVLGHQPDEPVHVLLTDTTDAANGSATAVPYDAIRLFVTAPDDMSPLGDHDDWMLELVTHEHTHVLHVDNISGLPALYDALCGPTAVNRWICGKQVAPNQAQPRWILEGLAVAMESRHTGGGRLRSTQFDMYLRADVLAGRLATLDQMSHSVRRWPSGNIWYLYGGKFIGWIADVYGPETFAAVSADYGANLIPWGINRSIYHATGRTYTQLYRGWKRELEQRYRAQAAEVRRRGVREGTRLTHHGRVASGPRWVPPCARRGEREEIAYYRDDGHASEGVWRLPLAARDRALEDEAEIWARTNRASSPSFEGCHLVFDGVAPSGRRYQLTDLFRQPNGTTSPRGVERSRQRLTTGRRASDPDVSRDGRRIVYVTNRAGTSTLRIASIDAEGRVTDERRLVPSARWEQAFTPRFSPDGTRVAYGVWTRGGFRDVRIVDVASGRFEAVTHDRALDQQPSWSPDGRTLYFTSDRTGIANVYAFDVASRSLRQVTNVLTGAYMPEVTPDGRTLFYAGYTWRGFDLYAMPLDESRFLPAPQAPAERPDPPTESGARRWPVRPYYPPETLRPRGFDLEWGPGQRGTAVQVVTSGSDIAGLHAVGVTQTIELEDPEIEGRLDYVYRRLPFDYRTSVYRNVSLRGGWQYGDEEPLVEENVTGVTSGVTLPLPGQYESQSASLSYTIARYDQELPVGTAADPYAAVTEEPPRGWLGLVRLGYAYSSVDSTAWAISSERGYSLTLGADLAAPATGSESTLTAVSGHAAAYVPMPWIDHHVLAVALSGGVSMGSYARRGIFSTGGFVDAPILDAFLTGVVQSAFLLRGYEPGQFRGSNYNLLNVEYRFPILYVDRGVSTLPAFFRGISGALYVDYGAAYNTLELERPFDAFATGLGSELWFDVVLGYFARTQLRLGYAYGTSSQAISGGQTYLVAQATF